MEAVDIFWIERTAIVHVEDAITVVVGIRAAVFILEAIEIFRLVRAVIDMLAELLVTFPDVDYVTGAWASRKAESMGCACESSVKPEPD